MDAYGRGLGGGGPLGLVVRGGLDGSRGLDPSILEDSGDFSTSRLRLRLATRNESSVHEALSGLEVTSPAVEATLSVATVWLRGFLVTS